MTCLLALYPLVFLLAGVKAVGIGEAWQVTPHTKQPVYADQSSRSRLDSSAFEVRTVSGVGRLAPADEAEKRPVATPTPGDPASTPSAVPEDVSGKNRHLEYLRSFFENSPYEDEVEEENVGDDVPPVETLRKMLRKTLLMRLLRAFDDDKDVGAGETTAPLRQQRFRRQADANETSMDGKISTTKSVREARLSSPETWSTSVQPISVEFRHRIPLDQVVQQQQQEEEAAAAAALADRYYRRYPPRVDFVTSHHRRGYPEYRESRAMGGGRGYGDDYEQMWYRNALRDRYYDSAYRRGYAYQYPERYRMERDYYARPTSGEPYYYYDRYDRYRDDETDPYGRQRSMAKPRRVIYYATLPEIVRKPVDLRNYPRGTTRDEGYKRVPGNVDPTKYRYRNGYDAYNAKRSNYYERGYGYADGELRRVRLSTKENLKNGEDEQPRRVSNLVAVRDDAGKLPWPVHIGTEVSIKDDERITGRKVFGESAPAYERYESAQLRKAPDTTGSSELHTDD